MLSTNLPFELMLTKWAAEINPVLSLPILNGNQINGLSFTATTPLVINHRLGRMPQGFFVTDINANTSVWRTQPFNKLTLTLETNADATVSLWVY